MSISFAAPPVIKRDTDNHETKLEGSSTVPSSFAGASSSASIRSRIERHGSVSSVRSSNSVEVNQRRPRSPEHKRSFEKKRVSFSTLANGQANLISLTLRTKHEAYKYSRRSRSFIIGYNDDEYSKSAMEWLLDTMVDDGDEIVALRVIDPKAVPDPDDNEEKFRAQARKMQEEIIRMNDDEDKELSIIVELAAGNVKILLLQLMHLYHPDSLIVGTKGRSLNGLSGLKPNSISKWCLQNSPIPVIVVRPDRKRDKAKQKRMQDPNRRSYIEILQKSSSVEDLNHAFEAQNLSPGIALDGPRPASKGLEVPLGRPATAASSASSRHGRQMSNASERDHRGKSPLGRLGHRVSKAFGDS